MSLFRVATLLVMCGIALSAVGKSGTPQNSATKESGPAGWHSQVHRGKRQRHAPVCGREFIGLAEAMPEDKYSDIPAVGKFDGVRSFGKQVKHVACAQFAFSTNLRARNRPKTAKKVAIDPAKTKAELISISRLLRLLEPRPPPRSRQTMRSPCRRSLRRTEHKLASLSLCLAHHRPLGQLVEYLRLNGIVRR